MGSLWARSKASGLHQPTQRAIVDECVGVDACEVERKDMLVGVVGNRSRTPRKRACQTNMSHGRDSAETWVQSGSRRVAETCSQEQRWIDVRCRNSSIRRASGLPLMHPLLSARRTSNTSSLAPRPAMKSPVAVDVSDVSPSARIRVQSPIAERHFSDRSCSTNTWVPVC